MFKFNGNYEDLEQVKEFYPDFARLYKEMKDNDKYPYNDDFKGKIKGIEEDEDCAIYLLQHLQTENNKQEKISKLLKEGYSEIREGNGMVKFEKVVMVGTNHSKDSTREFEKARILFKEDGERWIVPKGNKTRGLFVRRDRKVYAI